MEDHPSEYRIWVNWDDHTASLRFAEGYEMLFFFSLESFQSNLRILEQSGFRFQ